jgi:hypothetical protein
LPAKSRFSFRYPARFHTLKFRITRPCASRPVVVIVLIFPSGVTATRDVVVIEPFTFVE